MRQGLKGLRATERGDPLPPTHTYMWVYGIRGPDGDLPSLWWNRHREDLHRHRGLHRHPLYGLRRNRTDAFGVGGPVGLHREGEEEGEMLEDILTDEMLQRVRSHADGGIVSDGMTDAEIIASCAMFIEVVEQRTQCPVCRAHITPFRIGLEDMARVAQAGSDAERHPRYKAALVKVSSAMEAVGVMAFAARVARKLRWFA